MATLPAKAGNVTLLDFAKSLDPNGNTADVVEMLAETNEILMDMQWIEGNLPTGHSTTIRSGLPDVVWRKLYQGVQPSKSSRVQITDTVGLLEARAEIDVEVANLNGNSASFRLSEADAFIEAMSQEMAYTLFYGNTDIDPEKFMGLAPRFASSTAGNGNAIVKAGGAGSDNTSMWLVVWGPNTAFGIFPKGSKAGISHQDLGEGDAFDTQTPPARYRAYMDLWKWKAGLCVRDWRYVVRIANIDVSDLVAGTGTQANTAATYLPKLMAIAMGKIPAMGKGKAVFYANRTVRTYLSINAMDKTQNVLSIQEGINQFGSVSPGSANNGDVKFLGVPVRTVDQLLNTETLVS